VKKPFQKKVRKAFVVQGFCRNSVFLKRFQALSTVYGQQEMMGDQSFYLFPSVNKK
jgi:hypothetical protein